MDNKIVSRDKAYLELESERQYTFFTTPEGMSSCLNPEELLQVRDWINERVRELQFQGYLADNHLGD